MPAFRGFAPNKPIYPFATCSHSDSQVTLSFKPIPANRPTDVALDSQVYFFPFVLSLGVHLLFLPSTKKIALSLIN